MSKIVGDQTGQHYGEWIVLRETGRKRYNLFNSGQLKRWVLARCSCGVEKQIALSTLRNGTSKRCKICALRALQEKRYEHSATS